MKPVPWPTVGIVWLVSSVLVVAFAGRGWGWAQVGVGAVAAFAACVGAIVAPAVITRPSPAAAEHRVRKAWQVIAAGAVTVVGTRFFDGAGVAAIYGIVAALFVGALMPRQNTSRDGAPE